MSNTSSDSSTLEDDAPRSPRPWRPIVALLLLLCAGVYAAYVLPPLLRQMQTAHEDDLLSLAGLIAEEIEIVAQESDGTPDFAPLLTSSLRLDDSLAFIRLWSPQRALLGEVTRLAPTRSITGTSALPDLGFHTTHRRLVRRLTTHEQAVEVLHLQTLLLQQGELTRLFDEVDEATPARPGIRNDYFVLQSDTLKLAESLVPAHPALDAALPDMQAVLDALMAQEAPTWPAAARASSNAESSLTMALERFRALIAPTPSLPRPLLAHAPTSARWGGLWPARQGQRVLIPLYVPAVDDTTATLDGLVEVVFYPAINLDLPQIALHLLPSLLLGVLGLALLGRRRGQQPAPAAPELDAM
jgi:hypothetical protein